MEGMPVLIIGAGSERSCYLENSPVSSIHTISMRDVSASSAPFLNNDSFTEIDLTTDSGVAST